MARPVSDPRKAGQAPGFENVVDEICRGNYVLVLGSDIMLDKNYNTEADGDSIRFYLERILKEKRYPHAESFPELIMNNALNPTDVRRWLFDQIACMQLDPEDITPDLRRLLRTKFFRVVLTTTFDPSVETLMDEVWGKNNYRILNIFNSKGHNFDFNINELLGDEYFDVPPTLYYVFGKADPLEPEQKFVLDDNDTINCISRWLGNEVPAQLISYIDSKKMLVLGCNLKDWCFRFFWYAMRHKSTDKLDKGDIAVLLQPEKSEQDRNLYNYLHSIIKVRLQTNSREYLRRLADALDQKLIAETAVANSRGGGVFISYAHEDYAIAWKIFTRLRAAGFNVWLDYYLKGGDEYDKRIKNAINQCRVFVPLLSSTIAIDLKNGTQRYYQKEWDIACGPNDDCRIVPVITMGYDKREPYHQLLPEKMVKGTVFDWSKEPFDILISQIQKLL